MGHRLRLLRLACYALMGACATHSPASLTTPHKAQTEAKGPWLSVAQQALSQVERTHCIDGGVRHAADDQGPVSYLSDHVELVQAMAKLGELSMDAELLDRSDNLLAATVARFEDPVGHGFFAHTEDPGAVGTFAERLKPYEENALLVRLLVRMGRRKHGEGALEKARQTLLALASPSGLAAQQRRVASHAMAVAVLQSPFVVARVVGPATAPATRALYEATLDLNAPNVVVVQESPETSAYPCPSGMPTVYLCSDDACSAPVQTVADVAVAFEAFARP